MDFLDHLRAQKAEGEQEWRKKLAEEEERKAQEAARIHAEEEKLRLAQEEQDNRKAEAVFASLPELVRQAAGKGLPAAVLSDSIVEESPGDMPSLPMAVNRRTYHLKGWQIPFYKKCKEAGVPLTVVSERAEAGMKRVLGRQYHFLAIDLQHL